MKPPGNKRDILICLVLILFVIIIYWQAKDFKFVYYDDGTYVAERAHVMAGLTWDGFKWAMTAIEAGFWHPLTWLSLMLDRELFGDNPGGYHWTNVILHILNTLLLFLFLKRAAKVPIRSAIVALFFAIHPLHVESVAWLSQRKDLLCTFFGFSSLMAYVYYSESPHWRRYSVVLVLFILGLMSKPMIVTFPFVMLLMDYWPLQRMMMKGAAGNGIVTNAQELCTGRRPFGALLLEKLPLVVLSVIASVLVIFTEHKVQALTDLKVLSITDRFANALVSYVKYIAMMFWPANLTFYYPHPVTTPLAQVTGALLLLAVITAIIMLIWRRKRYLFTGWFWYVGTLVPVIGLIQVGPHAMADRYTYVPLIGLFIIIVWGASDLAARWQSGRLLLWVLLIVTTGSLSVVSWWQVSYWRNSVTLFEHALKIIPENYIALNNLGQYYITNGAYDKGLAYMNSAIQVKPKFGPLYYNVGLAMYGRRDYGKAIQYFKKAEQMTFVDDENRRMLGDCYRLMGEWRQAVDIYEKALEINIENVSARYGMALALMEMERKDEADKELRKTLLADPHHLSARKILMLLALKRGDMTTVVTEGQKAVANGSADAEVHKMMKYAVGETTGMDKDAFPVHPSKDNGSENKQK